MISTIALCLLVVLLQQVKTSLAQEANFTASLVPVPVHYCPRYSYHPNCLPGTELERDICKCKGDRPSYCPDGFHPFTTYHGLCGCQRLTKPKCPDGFTLNPHCDRCKIRAAPTCPAGSTVSHTNVFCIGSAKPTCPPGVDRKRCYCPQHILRKCPVGKLSSDGCSCKDAIIKQPQCSNNGYLNRRCCCENRRITCFYRTRCRGSDFGVNSVNECCTSPFRSYRIGNGRCLTCFAPLGNQ